MHNFLTTISGPTTAGKTSLLRALQARDSDIIEVISHTTRAPRAGEIDGVHYHFVTKAEFDGLEMVETFTLKGESYGTSTHELYTKLAMPGKIPVAIVDPSAPAHFSLLKDDIGNRLEVFKIYINISANEAARRIAERVKAASDISSVADRLAGLFTEELINWRTAAKWNLYITAYDADTKLIVDNMVGAYLAMLKAANEYPKHGPDETQHSIIDVAAFAARTTGYRFER